MKKLLSLALVAVLALTVFVGCGGNKSEYKDGKYRVEAEDFSKTGWKEFVEIEIKDGKIENLDFDAINKDGLIKTQDPEYQGKMEPVSGTYPTKFYPEIEEQYKKDPKAENVKNITGATHSVDGFKVLMTALEPQMKEGKTDTLKVKVDA